MDLKLKNRLRTIFNKYDPMQIYFDKKINFDEYDPEIEVLIPRFKRCNNLNEFTQEIYKLFQKMFFLEIAGPKNRYKKLSKEVYDLLKNEIKIKKPKLF